MKPSSAKQKGRRLQQWVAQQVSILLGIPWGPDEEIASWEMGQPGSDIRLVGKARALFPFSYIECKNQERWDTTEWISKLQDNVGGSNRWLLFTKKNCFKKPIVVLDAETFFALLRPILHPKEEE
jgi:hypothetical protein